MAKQLQIRRGTTAENDLFTGTVAEVTYDTDRKEIRIHDGSTVGGKTVSIFTGAIVAFGGSTAPVGWLICDGSAISRTKYADLFAVIGTTYGSGDGSTTFNLPDANNGQILAGTGVSTSLANDGTLRLGVGSATQVGSLRVRQSSSSSPWCYISGTHGENDAYYTNGIKATSSISNSVAVNYVIKY